MFNSSGPLCSACQPFLSIYLQATVDDGEFQYVLAPDFASLDSSANSGCSLCQIVRQCCLYQWPEALLLRNEHQVMLGFSNRHRDFIRQMSRSTNPDMINLLTQRSSLRKPMMRVSLEDYQAATLFLGREYSPLPEVFGMQLESPPPISHLLSTEYADQNIYSNQGIASIAAQAKSWLSICHRDHATCASSVAIDGHDSDKTVPTRLIDVGDDGEGQPARLHIVSRNYGNGIEYLALSYAWGPVTDFPKTTASNLQDMMAMLPWSALPRTIQDAIVFTKAMGIKYLWVDALCILQAEGPNDRAHKADWGHEAARFGHYYQNSVLTLAATGASSSDQGLFLPRLGLSEPLVYQEVSSSGTVNEVVIQQANPQWDKETEHSPLIQRGWATQERYLSVRVLHFAAHCVAWECRQLRATEVDPSGLHTEKFMRIWGRGRNYMSTFRDNQGDDSWIQNDWRLFVEGYSRALFSFDSDRLPALSGIAEVVKRRISENYIAGLWESSIPEGLCWMVDEPFSQSFQKVHGPPSWSWATVGKHVSFLTLQNPMLQVKSWKLKNNGVDTSGQVSNARLRLRGKVREFNLAELGALPNPDHDVIDNVLTSDHSPQGRHRNLCVYLDTTVARDIDLQNHSCLLVGMGTYYPQQSGNTSECALILEATGRRVNRVEEFKRIGFIECISCDWRSVKERMIDLV